ncbi:hypothetical protein HS125_11285 [bacterium]|nr:hypothetical protein [bacterium]
MDKQFLLLVQRHVANVAISPSTLRGQGPAGVVEAAQHFLGNLDLGRFRDGKSDGFRSELDQVAEELRQSLASGGQHWGAARKALNIFLRDALYNTYLRDAYRVDRLEPWLELPLDSYTAKAVRKYAPKSELPRWVGVKYVTADSNAAYQAAAAGVASEKGVARVHLDIHFWRGE